MFYVYMFQCSNVQQNYLLVQNVGTVFVHCTGYITVPMPTKTQQKKKRDRVVMIPIHNIKLYMICHLVQWIVFSRERERKKRPENIKFIFSFVAQYSLLTNSDKIKNWHVYTEYVNVYSVHKGKDNGNGNGWLI